MDDRDIAENSYTLIPIEELFEISHLRLYIHVFWDEFTQSNVISYGPLSFQTVILHQMDAKLPFETIMSHMTLWQNLFRAFTYVKVTRGYNLTRVF